MIYTVANRELAHPSTDRAAANGNGREPSVLSRDEVLALIETTSRELLGVSADEAFARLERGELDGTLAGGTLESLRWLLDS